MLYASLDSIYQEDDSMPTLLKDYQMRIHTMTDQPMKTSRLQVFSGIEKAYLKVKQELLLKKGQAEPSESAYRAPVMLVVYKDRVRGFLEKHGNDALKAMYDPEYREIVADFYRLTINLKMLNSVTIPDSHSMPLCRDILDEFVGCSYFSGIDLKDAFWTVPLHIADRHKTAFATHDMLLQWTV